ncbi:uncharacterized protein LOC143549447 [Bidens hawaiensis]|uniref:uncharacterized protein LOC143549447 n=1 Tax=Bidens hawaiensis TaxID=980011 RepID=UPI00404A8A8E
MAKIMMEKNQGLSYIRGSYESLPLLASALVGKYNSVKYLYDSSEKMNSDHWTDDVIELTLFYCLEMVSLVSFKLFHMGVQPASEEDTYAMKLLKIIMGHATRTMNVNDIQSMLKGPVVESRFERDTYRTPHSVLFVAAEAGNTWFIVELLGTNPDLMLIKNWESQTIFHIAVIHSHLGIYNLLYEIGDFKNEVCILCDKDENNLLHLVGRSTRSSSSFMAAKTSEASLFMQRELLWFKLLFVQPFPTS